MSALDKGSLAQTCSASYQYVDVSNRLLGWNLHSMPGSEGGSLLEQSWPVSLPDGGAADTGQGCSPEDQTKLKGIQALFRSCAAKLAINQGVSQLHTTLVCLSGRGSGRGQQVAAHPEDAGALWHEIGRPCGTPDPSLWVLVLPD